MQNKTLDIAFFICLFFLIVIIAIGPKNINFDFIKQSNAFQNYSEAIRQPDNNDIAKENDKLTEIPINSEIALSYKTKDEIYNIRKEYVNKSIFASDNYNPSDEVFGQIEDNKPWLSTQKTNKNNVCNVQGNSAHSLEIVNPSLLISIDWPYYLEVYGNNQSPFDFSLLPDSAYYSPATKKIYVEYSKLPISEERYYMLNGINARDFGYNYYYISQKDSQNLPKLHENPEIFQFLDFFHTGSSCGVDGGCNNWSPYQEEKCFMYNYNDYKQTNKIYIKLWKNKPKNKNVPADITEIITISGPKNK